MKNKTDKKTIANWNKCFKDGELVDAEWFDACKDEFIEDKRIISKALWNDFLEIRSRHASMNDPIVKQRRQQETVRIILSNYCRDTIGEVKVLLSIFPDCRYPSDETITEMERLKKEADNWISNNNKLLKQKEIKERTEREEMDKERERRLEIFRSNQKEQNRKAQDEFVKSVDILIELGFPFEVARKIVLKGFHYTSKEEALKDYRMFRRFSTLEQRRGVITASLQAESNEFVDNIKDDLKEFTAKLFGELTPDEIIARTREYFEIPRWFEIQTVISHMRRLPKSEEKIGVRAHAKVKFIGLDQ